MEKKGGSELCMFAHIGNSYKALAEGSSALGCTRIVIAPQILALTPATAQNSCVNPTFLLHFYSTTEQGEGNTFGMVTEVLSDAPGAQKGEDRCLHDVKRNTRFHTCPRVETQVEIQEKQPQKLRSTKFNQQTSLGAPRCRG